MFGLLKMELQNTDLFGNPQPLLNANDLQNYHIWGYVNDDEYNQLVQLYNQIQQSIQNKSNASN